MMSNLHLFDVVGAWTPPASIDPGDDGPPTRDEPIGVPTQRGPFSFPAPYNTRAVRITDARDGRVYPCGYGYWSRINNHQGRDSFYVLAGLHDHGPSIYTVDKTTHQVQGPRPLFAQDSPLWWDEADQWYFTLGNPDLIYFCTGPRFCTIDARDGRVETIFTTSKGASLFQPHSSDDGRTHSATLRDAGNHDVGVVVCRDGVEKLYEIRGDYDECQVDASGRWLLIKESNQRGGKSRLDNRILDLTGQHGQRVVLDEDGAVGHSDCGDGYAVGEDDQHTPGLAIKLDFATGQQTRVYELDQWDTGMGHVSVRQNFALFSHAWRGSHAKVNDLNLAPLDGSMSYRAVAPCLVNLDASGGNELGGGDYKKRPFANLDPIREYACWSSNHDSDRLDLFAVKL